MALVFPGETQDEEVLVCGEARLIRRKGVLHLCYGKVTYWTDADDDMVYRMLLPYARGNVLEVGLGMGILNQLLHQQSVTHVFSYEEKSDFIDIYNARYPTVANQTMEPRNAFGDLQSHSAVRFDLVVIDVDYTTSRAVYNQLKSFFQQIKIRLAANANVIVPYLGVEAYEDMQTWILAPYEMELLTRLPRRTIEWIRIYKKAGIGLGAGARG